MVPQKYSRKKHELGFYQADPTPSQEELKSFYENEYFQSGYKGGYKKKYSKDEIDHIENKAKISEYIWGKFGDKKVGTLLDIGAGEGFFSNYFFQKNWNVVLCDFASYGVENYNPHLLNHFVCGNFYEFLDEKIKSSETYDFINMDAILEHVADPVLLLEKVREVMTKQSLLRVRLPNDYSCFQNFLFSQGIIGADPWFAPPEHLNYFTFSSLEQCLKSKGFKIEFFLGMIPIEMYLLNENSHYYKDKKKGKGAYKASCLFEEYMMSQGIENYVEYMKAAAKCNFGRRILAYVSLEK